MIGRPKFVSLFIATCLVRVATGVLPPPPVPIVPSEHGVPLFINRPTAEAPSSTSTGKVATNLSTPSVNRRTSESAYQSRDMIDQEKPYQPSASYSMPSDTSFDYDEREMFSKIYQNNLPRMTRESHPFYMKNFKGNGRIPSTDPRYNYEASPTLPNGQTRRWPVEDYICDESESSSRSNLFGETGSRMVRLNWDKITNTLEFRPCKRIKSLKKKLSRQSNEYNNDSYRRRGEYRTYNRHYRQSNDDESQAAGGNIYNGKATSSRDPTTSNPLPSYMMPVPKESEPKDKVKKIDVSGKKIANYTIKDRSPSIVDDPSSSDPVEPEPHQTNYVPEQKEDKKNETNETDKYSDITAGKEKHGESEAKKDSSPNTIKDTSFSDPVKPEPHQTNNVSEQEEQKKNETQETDKFSENSAGQEKYGGSEAEKENSPNIIEATSTSDSLKPEPHPTKDSPEPHLKTIEETPQKSMALDVDVAEKNQNGIEAEKEHSPKINEATSPLDSTKPEPHPAKENPEAFTTNEHQPKKSVTFAVDIGETNKSCVEAEKEHSRDIIRATSSPHPTIEGHENPVISEELKPKIPDTLNIMSFTGENYLQPISLGYELSKIDQLQSPKESEKDKIQEELKKRIEVLRNSPNPVLRKLAETLSLNNPMAYYRNEKEPKQPDNEDVTQIKEKMEKYRKFVAERNEYEDKMKKKN